MHAFQYRWGRYSPPSAGLLASLLWVGSLALPAAAQKLAPANGLEAMEVCIDGRAVPHAGLSALRVPATANSLSFELLPEPSGKRRRYRLEGVDSAWREGRGEMVVGARFFDAKGDQIGQQDFLDTGESPGWNADLQRPAFVRRKETLTAPPQAAKFWFVISSAGPPTTMGTILVEGVTITRSSASGSSAVILRAPVGRDTHVAGSPVPLGFWMDGARPSMARLLTLAPVASQPPRECFAIQDDDSNGHAEWHTGQEDAPPISSGEQLGLEWNEAFSVGFGGRVQVTYDRPPAGSYRFRVQEVDLLGRPTGVESSLAIHVLAPWWQRPWGWLAILAGTLASAFGVTRYVAHRRVLQQLVHLKEERLVEQERLRIARDIHDTLAQGFTGIIVQLKAADDARSRGLVAESGAHLHRAEELARESLQEARRSVRALRPQALERADLAEALRELFGKMSVGTELHTELIVAGPARPIATDGEDNLLRIGQEALTNALRHARARHFTARLTYDTETLTLAMRDDGCGFDPTRRHDGFGLLGMRERVELMGGEFTATSVPGEGTAVSVLLPLPALPPKTKL